MSMYLDLEDLVERAKAEQVSSEEIEKIANALPGSAGTDTYRLLYVLLRMRARKYEDLIAGFISYPSDAQVAALALSNLCVQWGLAGRYRDRIIEAIDGIGWDDFGELKQSAISAAGEYLTSTSDSLLLKKLIDIAMLYETDLSGRFAIEALARALGDPHSVAVFPREVKDGQAWAMGILERGTSRLAAERSSG